MGAQCQGRRQCPEVSGAYHQNGKHALPASYACDIQLLITARILEPSRFAKCNIAAALSSRLSKKGCMTCKQWLPHMLPNDAYQYTHTHTRSLIDFRRCFEGGAHHIKNNTDAEGRTPCQEQKALYAPKSKQFHTKFVSHTGETQEHMIQSLTPRYSQRCIYSD